MRTSKLQLFLGFLLLVVLAASLWLLQIFFIAWTGADKSIQTAIIAAAVGVFTVTFTFWKERSRSIREAHRDKKIEVYSKFYDMMFGLLKNTKQGVSTDLESDSKFQDAWFEISRGVLFYGSPNVVKAFSEFKADPLRPPFEIMRAMGRILLAMRSDIGLSNFGLDELTIHQIYITDDVRTIGQTQ